MRRAITFLVLLFACNMAPGQMQPTTKWYLDPEEMSDPEYRAMITRSQQRAASLDEAGIRKLVETLLVKEQSADDHWTLIVLDERAAPALVAALDDPRFAELEELYPNFLGARRLERVLSYLEWRVPATAVPALAKLVAHPSDRVRTPAALAVASIGNLAAVAPTRAALRDGEHFVRSSTLIGISRAMQNGRADPGFLEALFDDVAAVIDQPSVGGTDAPQCLLELNRERATAYLLDPVRFRADHRQISSIAHGLARARVKVPGQRVVALLDALPNKSPPNNITYAYALELLALSTDPSAAARVERDLGDADDSVRDGAAQAYLILNRIPDAYQVAIDRWGGPEGDHGGVPEPVLLYAAVHVMNNEVGNGSFGQYFFNDYGKEAALAIKGLDAIGARHSAAIAREVVALFGPSGPAADREARQKQLDAIDGGTIERLSDAWLKDPDHLTVLLARYAVKHKQHFVTPAAPATSPAGP